MEINKIHSKAVPTGLLDQIRKRLSSLGKRTGSASNRKEWVTNMLWWKIIILASWRIVVHRTYWAWKWHFIQKLRSSNFNSFFYSKSQAPWDCCCAEFSTIFLVPTSTRQSINPANKVVRRALLVTVYRIYKIRRIALKGASILKKSYA